MTNAFRGEFCNELVMVCKLWKNIICFRIYDHTAYAAIFWCRHTTVNDLLNEFALTRLGKKVMWGGSHKVSSYQTLVRTPNSLHYPGIYEILPKFSNQNDMQVCLRKFGISAYFFISEYIKP